MTEPADPTQPPLPAEQLTLPGDQLPEEADDLLRMPSPASTPVAMPGDRESRSRGPR